MRHQLLATLIMSSAISQHAIADNQFTRLHDFSGDRYGRSTSNLVYDEQNQTLYGHTDTHIFSMKTNSTYNTFKELIESGRDTINEGYSFDDALTLSRDHRYIFAVKNSNQHGSLLKLDVSTNKVTELHHFSIDNAIDGYDIRGGIIESKDGRYLYGVSESGGGCARYECGILYRIDLTADTSSNFKVLHRFKNGTDGGAAVGSLAESPDGRYIYGITSKGGAEKSGTLFQLSVSDNAYKIIHDFTYENGSPNDLILSQDGRFAYGTAYITNHGNRPGIIYEVDLESASHPWRVLYQFGNDKEMILPIQVTISHDGETLYGATEYHGGTLFKLSIKQPTNLQRLYRFYDHTGVGMYENPNAALVINRGNNTLYGLTEYGGSASHGGIFKLNL